MENTLLNLIPSSYIPEVHLSQYDVGRELTFKLMDGNTEYSVPSGAVVTVKATKPSGLGFVVSGTFSGNIVTIVNTETMTNESGRFSAELSISNGSTLLGTSNFIFNIERSPHPEGTTDGDAETLIPELTLLVNEIRESNAKVESMTASATSLPSGSEPTAEYDPDTNNLAFGIPVSEVTAEDLYKAFIVKSASGSIASFSDGGDDLPMKSLKVNITPKQSGSGDPSPSNVRPISGWDSVDVNKTGVNVWNEEWELGGIRWSTGETFADNNFIRNKGYIGTKPNTDYFATSGISAIYFYDENKAHISTVDRRTGVFTTPPNAKYLKFVFVSTYGTTYKNDTAINHPSTATAYEPYNGSTITTNLPQTVYGGTLDVVSGKLTLTKGYKALTSADNYTYNGTVVGTASQWIFTPNPPKANGVDNFFSNRFKTAVGDTSLYNVNGRAVNGNLYFNIPESIGSDGTLAKQWFADNPTQICYELATPTEIQLTPTEVKTLLGSNNIWSDSGTVEVEYRADTTLAYEELANAIISLGGNI